MTNATARFPSTLLLLLLGCAGAAAAPATPAAPAGKPKCGPGGPPGAKCGPPAPAPAPDPAPPVAAPPLASPDIITMTSYLQRTGLVRAAVIRPYGSTAHTLVVERFDGVGQLALVGSVTVTIDGAPIGDAIRELHWRGDQLRFNLGADRDQYICQLDGAVGGASAAECVIARGGGRPTP